MPYTAKVTSDMSWHDIPTCKESGLPVDYLMLRGIFMPPGVTQDQVNYYIDLFKKVRETPDWKAFTEQAAFNQSFMTGAEYVKWLEEAEAKHKALMEKAGFMAKK
jgi:tripartite-type tricarboxylate transporter receptor subunit TctC